MNRNEFKLYIKSSTNKYTYICVKYAHETGHNIKHILDSICADKYTNVQIFQIFCKNVYLNPVKTKMADMREMREVA